MVFGGTVALLVGLIVVAYATTLTEDGKAYSGVFVRLPGKVLAEQRREVLQQLRDLLRDASEVLHKAIGLYFRDIIFIVPLSWQMSLDLQYDEIAPLPSKVDVVVTSTSDTVFGRSPYALQFGRCATEGLQVNIPLKFLFGSGLEQPAGKGKLFAREWIKMRYGVFDENGHKNDAFFPPFYKTFGTEEIQITGCSNTVVSYIFRDKTGNECNLEVDKVTNFPRSNDDDCSAKPDTETNGNISSSLMDLQLLENADSICGDTSHTHQKNSPNKQNVLCQGRSIWDVLKDHTDFKAKSGINPSSVTPTSPMFRYMKETNNRIVVAIDTHTSLDKFKGHIKNAVGHMVYSVPPGTEFGITTGKSELLQILTKPEDNDFSQLNNYLLSINIMFRKVDVCSECVIKPAIQMLSKDPPPHGTIIFISSVSPRDLDPGLLDSMKTSMLNFIIIYFSNVEESFGTLSDVIIRIPDEDSLSSLKQLYEAMEQAIIPTSQTKKTKLLATELSSSKPVTFSVDQTIDSLEFWFSNKSALDLEMDNDDVVLVADQDDKPQILLAVVQKNFFLLRAKNTASNSQWTCTLQNVPPVLMNVIAILKDGDQFDIIAWMDDETQEASLYQFPITLYVKISYGGHPVINAGVKAQVTNPDGSSQDLVLLDNGIGDPDITKNDGIYSRYFTQFTTPGKYKVIFFISDDNGRANIAKPGLNVPGTCCGSQIFVGELQDTIPFQRSIKLSFRAKSGRPDEGYSPSTITNLRVLRSGGFYKLVFTAPGSEKDQGKVAQYKLIQCHENNETSSCNGDQQALDIPKFTWTSNTSFPQSYGQTEELQLHMPENVQFNYFYFLSIISVNENNKESQPSNQVQLFLSENPPDTTDDSKKEPSTGKLNSMEPATIGYIIGAVLAITAVIVGYLIFCYVSKRKKKLSADEVEDAAEVKKDISNDDGSVVANEWNIDRNAISPVNSIPAIVLLNHHEQVQEAKRRHQEPPLFTLEDVDNKKLPSISEGSTRTLDEDCAMSIYVNHAMENSSENIHYLSEDQAPPKPLRRVTKV